MGRPGDPLTRQRSAWRQGTGPELPYAADGTTWWSRNVNDGVLFACRAQEPLGPDGALEWHLSISFRNHKGDPSRYPTWDEIAHCRYELLPDDVDFMMVLPKADNYVAAHPTTFHLHELHRRPA